MLGLAFARSSVLAIDAVADSFWVQIATWCAFTIALGSLGSIFVWVLDSIAAGSGIPEMKTIISYDLRHDADRFLRLKTLVAKSIGLTLALGSNISVGREGPFVHIASIIAHILMKHVPFFQRIYRNDILRHQMYNAACAVGVATTFQAPVGGVLFAIEVTSTTFMVSNYWRAFVAALSGSITRQVVRIVHEADTTSYAPMFSTNFPDKSFHHVEFIAFAVLGIAMGLAGAVYVALSSAFKVRWQTIFAKHPLPFGFLLLLVICGVMYAPGEFGQLSSSKILLDLWSVDDLSSQWHPVSSSIFWILPIAAVCRLVATMLSTSLPLPAGDFIPTFIAGTMFGRLYGEILHSWFPESGIVAGGYALVGGAAFTGAATHTISVAGSYFNQHSLLRYPSELTFSCLYTHESDCNRIYGSVCVYDALAARCALRFEFSERIECLCLRHGNSQ